jgi:CheY-like chemotaxis protein
VNLSLTILIVEDNPQDVLLLRKALIKAQIEAPVQVVGDGVEAIEYLRGAGKFADRAKFPFPSVLFSDLKMPRMGGFEILEWLRSHEECAVIPMIILTNSSLDADVRRAYVMGANAYLVKPQRFEDLVEMVRTAYQFWAWCETPSVRAHC